jgi:ubiquinone/menaquinone biosynthesis C-methylase UbiE
VTDLSFTGERFVPGVAGEIWYEHWHRYHLAAAMVAGRHVLDVACGAGYGSALLARHAASVTGVDIAPDVVAHACTHYGAQSNLRFEVGDCAALPLPDQAFDAVVSFETMEHIAAQDAFLDEIRRVLRPGGLLILSCPNKREYSETRGTANPFHVRELYREELAEMLDRRFAHAVWFGQHVSFFSVIAPEQDATAGEIFELREDDAATRRDGHAHAVYFLVVASDDTAALATTPRTMSVLADASEWVRRDYEKVTRELHAAHERGNALDREVASWQGHHAEAVRQRDGLQAEIEKMRAVIAARDDSLAAAEAWRRKLEGDIATLKADGGRSGLPRLLRHLLRRMTRTGKSS